MSRAYTLLASEAAYRQAADTVLALAEREILIFDRDLAALRLDEKARLEVLAGLLQKKAMRRIRIVLHTPEPVERNAPRLCQLIERFSHVVDVRQTPENLRHLADTHMIADDKNGLRRFHVDQPRSALIQDDHEYLQPWRQRFEELWELSHPCLTGITTRL